MPFPSPILLSLLPEIIIISFLRSVILIYVYYIIMTPATNNLLHHFAYFYT